MNNLEQAVDYLNLHLGIVHGDVCPWNLLIDAETDSIQLFGFSLAAKLGWEGDQDNFCEFGYDKARNDVKFVIMTTYELITRKLYSRRKFNPLEEDACKLLKKRKWTTHEEAKLDSNVREYRRVLSDWVKQRTERKIDHFTKASEPLNWPPLVVDPLMAWDISPFRKKGRLRLTLRQLGVDFVRWERPPTRSLPLPDGRRLLAMGEVVEDRVLDVPKNKHPARGHRRVLQDMVRDEVKGAKRKTMTREGREKEWKNVGRN